MIFILGYIVAGVIAVGKKKTTLCVASCFAGVVVEVILQSIYAHFPYDSVGIGNGVSALSFLLFVARIVMIVVVIRLWK